MIDRIDMMGYQMGGRPRGSDVVGSVSTLPNLAIDIVWGTNTKRPLSWNTRNHRQNRPEYA